MAMGKFQGVITATGPTGCFHRVAEVVRQLGGDRFPGDPARLPGEEFDDVDGALDLAAGFRKRLAFFAGQRFGELLAPLFHAALHLEEELPADGRWRLPPALERAQRGIAGLRRLGRCRGGRFRNHVGYVRRIQILDAASCRLAPFTADEVVENSHFLNRRGPLHPARLASLRSPFPARSVPFARIPDPASRIPHSIRSP
jgi:hypothetical protein